MEDNSSKAAEAALPSETNNNAQEGKNVAQEMDKRNDKRKKPSKWRSYGKNKKKKEPWYRNRGENHKPEGGADGGEKKEKPKNNRRQDDWESKSPKTVPHEGSFRHEDMQKLFGVKVDVPTKDNSNNEDEEAHIKVPKRKLSMLVSFLGSNYGGFQINAGQRTLQAELELGFFRAGIIAPSNFGWPSKYSWSNSARTDKGVHGKLLVKYSNT